MSNFNKPWVSPEDRVVDPNDWETPELVTSPSVCSFTPTTGWSDRPNQQVRDLRPNFARGLHRDQGEWFESHPRLRILQMTESVKQGTTQAELFADPSAVNFQMELVREIQLLGLRLAMEKGTTCVGKVQSFRRVLAWNVSEADPVVYAYNGKV